MTSFEMGGIEYRFFDHLFAVSKCGKVLRLKPPYRAPIQQFSPYTPRSCRADGYLTLGRQRLMHRAVAICWIPNPDNKKHVHHINEDKTDNRACNLQWVTPKEHFGERHQENGYYIRSKETVEKMRASKTGVKQSEESNARRSAAMKLHRMSVPVLSKTKCSYKGVIYESQKEAALAAGVTRGCFVKRCRSKNFPDYELV